MRKKILIFIFGAVAGVLIRDGMIAYLTRPRDISASWSPEIRKQWNSPDMAFEKIPTTADILEKPAKFAWRAFHV